MGSFEDEINRFLADEKKQIAEQSARDAEAQQQETRERERASRDMKQMRDYVENTIRPALEALQVKLDGQAGRHVTIKEQAGMTGLAISIEGPDKAEFRYLVSIGAGGTSLTGQATFNDERGITHRPRSEELANQQTKAGFGGVTEGDITRYVWRAYTSSLEERKR